MSPSNLGIVFGPSLMRPRPTGATVSLSSLVDYPHQARIIETLIVFYTAIFQSKSSSTSSRPSSISIQQVCVCVTLIIFGTYRKNVNAFISTTPNSSTNARVGRFELKFPVLTDVCLPLLVQSVSVDVDEGSSAVVAEGEEQEAKEEQSRTDSDKMEEGCGKRCLDGFEEELLHFCL